MRQLFVNSFVYTMKAIGIVRRVDAGVIITPRIYIATAR